MKAFEARTIAEPAQAVVVLSGDCDLSARDRMTTLLLAAVDDAPLVAVDLAGVTFMDSSGLHALITAHHSAQRRGRQLYVRGATGVVGALLELTGLAGVLHRD
jgi:anti-anti-sigma factor